MTNIRQHLPGILSVIRQHLTIASPAEALRARLRELLPASYGIDTGSLINEQGQQSEALDVIIYDTTIVIPEQPHRQNPCYDLRQVLAVIVTGHQPERVRLQELLRIIASVKSLRSGSEEKQAKITKKTKQAQKQSVPSLKKLLPIAIVGIQCLLDYQEPEQEEISLAVDAHIKEQKEQLRPDYLVMQSYQLLYSNPLLTGETFTPSTIHIACAQMLKKPHACYVCKKTFNYSHFFYQHLCLACGDFNYQKRIMSANLTGRNALVTGARVKIGYATALRLLRAGAQVIITTRFPHDAARRYSAETDFSDWQDRLQIYGLDFRYLPMLERFVDHLLEHYPALDILINNAAQTVRRPPDYYAHLQSLEQAPLEELTPAQQELVRQSHILLPPTPFTGIKATSEPLPINRATEQGQATSATLLHTHGMVAALPQKHDKTLFPTGRYDEYEQQIDLRTQNSWTLPFNEIDLTEFLEVQIINVTAPFLLVSRLHPHLCRSSFKQRFIINVSAVEGQFANAKQGKHVHTNMAKASLNMLTHTASAHLANDSIFMNSVDPGWISQQSPLTDTQEHEKIQNLLPLDLTDAAARICDPIFMDIATGNTLYGHFYKNYQPTSW